MPLYARSVVDFEVYSQIGQGICLLITTTADLCGATASHLFQIATLNGGLDMDARGRENIDMLEYKDVPCFWKWMNRSNLWRQVVATTLANLLTAIIVSAALVLARFFRGGAPAEA